MSPITIPGLGVFEFDEARRATPASVEDDRLAAFWATFIPQETLDGGSIGSLAGWPVRIGRHGDVIRCSELDRKSDRFIDELAFAAVLYERQTNVCGDARIDRQCPSAFQLVAAPRDYNALDLLAAFRVPSPPHMSGWWLYDATRNENEFDSYVTFHLHHIVAECEAFGSFIALPPGYRAFPTVNGYSFDPSLLDEE